MEHELRVRVVLEQPPAGVDVGLQKGRGSAYQTIQTQRSAGGDLRFECVVRVAVAQGAAPNLLGPFVQGPPGGRFLYLDIGTYAGQQGTPWSRRLKIPLDGITRELVERAAIAGQVLEARVAGTGRDGGPTCGTVRPFSGWHARAA